VEYLTLVDALVITRVRWS